MARYNKNLLAKFKIRGSSDVIVAAMIVIIVGIIIIPLPTAILDVLLACSLASGLLMLLMTLFITEPLEMCFQPYCYW